MPSNLQQICPPDLQYLGHKKPFYEVNPDLQFLPSASCLMMFNFYKKFHEDIFKQFLSYRVDTIKIYFFQFQRASSPKICNPELWFLCSVCHLMWINICVKLCEDSLNGFHVIERTRFVMTDRHVGDQYASQPKEGRHNNSKNGTELIPIKTA